MKISLVTVLIASGCAALIFAQTPASTPGIVNDLRSRYEFVKTTILAAADAMPEANYSFKPVPEEMSFGEWVAHIADVQVRQCSVISGPAKRVDAASKKSKAEMITALKAAFDECDAAFGALTEANALEIVPPGGRGQTSRAGALAYVTAHDNEGYGSMAVYLRLKGVFPPSTAIRQMGAAAGASGRGR